MVLEEIRKMTIVQLFAILAVIGVLAFLTALLISPQKPTEIWTNGWMKKMNGWVKWNKKKKK